MNVRGIPLLIKTLRRGEFQRIIDVLRFYAYRIFSSFLYRWHLMLFPYRKSKQKRKVYVRTKHPVAFTSPDHIVPWGTKHDNTSHKGFVLTMDRLIHVRGRRQKSILDLGCAGGQVVKEFCDVGWFGIGLEGSDYSLKHKRANWPALAGKNLFTCDISKRFEIYVQGKRKYFELITAWEVLEHIGKKDLKPLFGNIVNHLNAGGYFIASTTSLPDVRGGVDLHQTKMTNRQWKNWIHKNFPEIKPRAIGLQFYQFVRYNAERSFLVYEKN